ncbi:hypothetical protein EZV62_017353 [Acer yangbiense]|uniref:Uncharacterized protein n=1 Tax=Acer yangbiense TaxID=1000413 RepID=A0A5C7HG60_9ROSI|nr:hypothetical protein EZV62_017353 [Acer yangbiense]
MVNCSLHEVTLDLSLQLEDIYRGEFTWFRRIHAAKMLKRSLQSIHAKWNTIFKVDSWVPKLYLCFAVMAHFQGLELHRLKSHLHVTTSKRLAVRKVDKFEKNILKRGAVPETTVKKGKDYPVGPVLLGFFVFVVIGSYHQDGNKRRDGIMFRKIDDTFTRLMVYSVL